MLRILVLWIVLILGVFVILAGFVGILLLADSHPYFLMAGMILVPTLLLAIALSDQRS